MNTKYEFAGETKGFFGHTLRRIRALCSFGTVVKGDLGGWIESEANLEVFGNGWVFDDGWVFGNGRVFGNGQVFGDGRVSGDGQVFGDADFFLAGPLGSRRAFLTIHADAKIGVRFTTGCFSGTEKEFRDAIQDTHGDYDHAKQYLTAIDFALLIVKPATDQR